MIIGEGGETIKTINRNTGARAFVLDDRYNDGRKEFRIIGEPEQVKKCMKIIYDLGELWKQNSKR